MNAILAQFGVGGDVAPQIVPVAYPKAVPGRVAHIDADFMAYQVSAESDDELKGRKPRRSIEDMQHNARNGVEHLMQMAGATSYMCHVTPSGSNKGNRPAQAIQQEYQASRQDRDRPEHLDLIRAFIGAELNGVVHLDQEADDGMAQANYNAVDRNLSVIVSKDKDLRMAPGLHYDFDTETVIDVTDSFGYIWVDDTKSSKTLKGWGTKFFWAQCLMGDPADYIKGLPALAGSVHCAAAPTGAYTKAYDDWIKAADGPKAGKAQQKLDAILAKTKPCGPVITAAILEHVKTDAEAWKIVKGAWCALAAEHGWQFQHWNTTVPVTPTQALLGDMQLLWMRRNKNPMDVVVWLKEVLA
jgi:hypothetical protein